MITLCLNNCQANQRITGDVYGVFETMLRQYRDLRSVPSGTGLVAPSSPQEQIFGGVPLSDLLKRVSKTDKDLGRFGFAAFSRNYPLGPFLPADLGIDDVDLCQWQLFGEDASELFMAHSAGFWLMTLPLGDECRKDTLTLTAEHGKTVEVGNWHGLNSLMLKRAETAMDNRTQQLLTELKFIAEGKRVMWTDEFEQTFRSWSVPLQEIVINRFKDAINANLLFPSRYDDNIVKKCSGIGSQLMYELRQLGSGIRVYFLSDNDNLYVSALSTKAESAGDEQTADICRAANWLKKLLIKAKAL